jgi:hypothetical protein
MSPSVRVVTTHTTGRTSTNKLLRDRVGGSHRKAPERGHELREWAAGLPQPRGLDKMESGGNFSCVGWNAFASRLTFYIKQHIFPTHGIQHAAEFFGRRSVVRKTGMAHLFAHSIPLPFCSISPAVLARQGKRKPKSKMVLGRLRPMAGKLKVPTTICLVHAA